ncbi:MAG: 3-oxoacyl-ACP reductase FabG [Acidimicrobiales bacterium]
MSDVHTPHAFVTAGAKGIGAAVVRALRDSGFHVTLTYRNSPADETVLKDEGVFATYCEISDPESVQEAFSAAESKFGPVDVLVANAGMTKDTLLLRMSEEDFTSVIDTNLTSAYRLAKRALPSMIRSRSGRIVFISSVVAFMGSAGQVNYAASKAGIVGLARSLAREVASRSITVNVVAPGAVDTDILHAAGASRTDSIVQAIPQGRLGTPEEIAEAVKFLSSPGAAYVTGVVLPVDGGLAMGI